MMENEKEKLEKLRLEIIVKIVTAIISNPKFTGTLSCIPEYVEWADKIIKENKNFSNKGENCESN